jgi:hypothetical protein
VYDLAIIFIQRALRKKDRRLIHEAELIRLLDTVTPKGMNKIMPILRHTMGKEMKKSGASGLRTTKSPKMTWLQTAGEENDKPSPIDNAPKRHYKRDDKKQTYRVQTIDENKKPITQNDEEFSNEYENPNYGKRIETLDERKKKRKNRTHNYSPDVQYGMVLLLAILQW